MRAVIISGGIIRDYEFIKSLITEGDTVICADSGYYHALRMGLKVSVCVGDFDSIGYIPDEIKTIRYPVEKDLTDTEIAFEYCRDEGFRDFLLLAATGSRLDHALTNILLLKNCLERDENAVIVDEHNKIMLTSSRLRLCEPPGSIVSLVPLTDCRGVKTENLEYPLRGESLFAGKGRGVSNIMTCEQAEVSVQEGILLVIVARD